MEMGTKIKWAPNESNTNKKTNVPKENHAEERHEKLGSEVQSAHTHSERRTRLAAGVGASRL